MLLLALATAQRAEDAFSRVFSATSGRVLAEKALEKAHSRAKMAENYLDKANFSHQFAFSDPFSTSTSLRVAEKGVEKAFVRYRVAEKAPEKAVAQGRGLPRASYLAYMEA